MDNEFDKINKMMDSDIDSKKMFEKFLDTEASEMFELTKKIQKVCDGHSLFAGSVGCSVACAMILASSSGREEDNLFLLELIGDVQKDIIKNRGKI